MAAHIEEMHVLALYPPASHHVNLFQVYNVYMPTVDSNEPESRVPFNNAADISRLSPSKLPPIPTLERLTTYLRCLLDAGVAGIETMSSSQIEAQSGVSAAQFRKDLSYFGEFGKPGVGYNVTELEGRIARILQIHKIQPILLVGAGNLGSALAAYPSLQEHKFHIVAVFDTDPAKIGKRLWNMDILDFRRLADVNQKLMAKMAILAVPAIAAQHAADLLIDPGGIRAILNFAPVLLKVPSTVIVRNVSFVKELAVLSYHLTESDNGIGDL